MSCESTELDAAGVAILETRVPRGVVADYETAVTHSSGSTLGTYFKRDLARVMGLSGNERLDWKVVDRDKALVRVHRGESFAVRNSTDSRVEKRPLGKAAENTRKRGRKEQIRA